MARELLIVWAGKHQRKGWEELCEDYRRRIARWVPIRDLPVRARPRGDERSRLESEAAALGAVLPEPVWLVALDRRGKQVSSLQFAQRLERLRRDWPHPVAFVVGSDLGLLPELVATARERLSLGPMTLPHELARLVLYEQIYRALSLEAGIKYHREPLA